ncbi:glycosyltransferase [Testudinibacter sp. P80/BLE/0925]|uniref:glycosyltransferase n=1 Tax=Testudinibacter sp. TW-1 TaxID=3417757 RepID=UPI003D366252
MKIWFLTSEFPPSFGGGISTYIKQICLGLSQLEHEVTVITRGDSDEVENINSNYRVLRFKHMEHPIYSALGYWAALSYQISDVVEGLIKKEGKPDLIEVQEYNALGYYLFQRRFALEDCFQNLKIVVHMHTPIFELMKINQEPRYKFSNYWIGQMEKFAINSADALLTQSQFLAKKIRDELDIKNSIEIIPLPFDEIRSSTKNIEYDFLYIGRFEYRKGVVQLLSHISKMWENNIKFKLCMIGGDTFFYPKQVYLKKYLLEKYSKWIELGYLVVKDNMPPENLHHEISQLNVVIIPSLYENYPYTCVTSMMLGKPILASISGGQAEMVGNDRTAGFIFDWDKQNSFENELQNFLNLDLKTIKEMGEAARNRVMASSLLSNNLAVRISFYHKVIDNATELNFPEPEYIKRLKLSTPVLKNSYNNKKISIIIPYYNLGEYIIETLESALSSDLEDFEIIIVNDGSTDLDSLQKLEDIKNNFIGYDIRVINIQNSGLANARNVGAVNAKGEYITFLDADDLVYKDFYSSAIKILDRFTNISFVYSWLEYFENGKGVWPTFNTELPFMCCANMLSAFCIVRKSDFLEFGLNHSNMEYGMEDYDSWLAMVSNGCIGFSIPKVLVKYRVRHNSMSRQFNKNMILYLYDILSKNNNRLYKEYGNEIYNLISSNGPGYFWNNPTYELPPLGIANDKQDLSGIQYSIQNLRYKNELIRIAESKIGSFLLRALFKLKINKLF